MTPLAKNTSFLLFFATLAGLIVFSCGKPAPKSSGEVLMPDGTFADTTKMTLEDTALVDYGPSNAPFVDEEEEGRNSSGK